MTIMSEIGDEKHKPPAEENLEDLEDGEIEDDEEEVAAQPPSDPPAPPVKEEPIKKAPKESKKSLKRSLDADEEKQRILKEKLKMLERQMAGDPYYEDEDEEMEDEEDEQEDYTPEESGDDEEMGVYTAGGSPKRFKFEEGVGGPPMNIIGKAHHSARDRRNNHPPPRRNNLGNQKGLIKRGRCNVNSRRNPRKKKSDEICKLFMQGKCQKSAENCLYSHDAVPPKMMELCKFYLFERCAKRDKCLYLHKEFPCKYFHTGNKCVDSAKDCKFSHEPLTDDTRGILLKHLESAPKEILGEFPRLTRDVAASVVFNIEAKNKGWLEDPSSKDQDSEGEDAPGDGNSDSIDKEAKDRSDSMEDSKSDYSDPKSIEDGKRKRKSRWETGAENASVSTGESKQNHFSAVPFPTNISSDVPPGYGCPNFSEKFDGSEVQNFLKEQREEKLKLEQDAQNEKDDIEIKQTPVPASLPGKRSNQGFSQFIGGGNFQGRNFNNGPPNNFNNGSNFMGKSNFNGPPGTNFNGPINQNFSGPPNQNFNGPPNQNFHGPPNQGFNGPQNHNFNGPQNQGFNGPPNQNFNSSPNQGFNGPPNQNFIGPPNQGFNGPSSQNFNGPPNQGFNAPPNQGFNGPPNQGFNGPPNQGFNNVPSNQNFSCPPNQNFNNVPNQNFNGPPNSNYNQNYNGFNNGGNGPNAFNGPPGNFNGPRSHNNFNGPRGFSNDFRGGNRGGGRFNGRGNFRGGRGGRGNFNNNSQRGQYFGGPNAQGSSGWNNGGSHWNNSGFNQYNEDESYNYNREGEEEDYYNEEDPNMGLNEVENVAPEDVSTEPSHSEAPLSESKDPEGPSSPPPGGRDPRANRDPRARRDPRKRDSPQHASSSSSVPDEAEKERRILDLDISAFGDLEIPSLKNEDDEEEEGLPFKANFQQSLAKEIDASILSRPPIEYSLQPFALEKPDYMDIIQKHHIPTSQISQDPRLRRYSEKPTTAKFTAPHAGKPTSGTTTTALPPPESPLDVYNPKRDLIQQKYQNSATPNVPPTNESSGAYSPSQDIQDMYGKRGGLYTQGQPQEDVYNPRKDLSTDYGYPQSYNKSGSNRNDPRMSRRDPRRRD